MSIRDRVYLTWSYGKPQLIIGGVYNLFCTQLLALSFSYTVFVDAFIIKAALYAVTLYLTSQLRARDAAFFYINLGLSRRRMQLGILLTDFLALALLLTIVLLFHGEA